ncbi:MAG: hypothetical protein QM729_13120 [Solirubrobacterales bacterium]
MATSVCHQLAGELVLAELEAAGKLDGLSKKDAKRLAADATRAKASELAEQLATVLSGTGIGDWGLERIANP